MIFALSMLTSTTHTQSVISPRALSLSSYAPSVRDVRGFTLNPAGLAFVRDWDFQAVTYKSFHSSTDGLVFHGFSLAKRFLEHHALAVQYAPGTTLEFSYPPQIIGNNIGSDETTVLYDEPASLAYAFLPAEQLSVGLSSSLKREIIKQQVIRTGTEKLFEEEEHRGQSWHFDLGVLWRQSDNLSISLAGRELFHIAASALPIEYDTLRLSTNRMLEAGASYRILPQLIGNVSISSRWNAGIGFEWSATKSLSFTGGLYYDKNQSPSFAAFSAGVGWSYDVFAIEASFLRFVDQSNRGGQIPAQGFDPSSIRNINLNPYTTDRLSVGVKVIFGNVRESLVRIEAATMVGGIYPSAYEAFVYKPIGTVRVKNISSKPVQAKASFFVERFMDAPTESQPVYLTPGEEREIPLNAVFNETVRRVPTSLVREGNVYVNATPADDYDDRMQTKVLIYGKNAWDGDVLSLRYFITPDDPMVLRYSRDVLLEHSSAIVENEVENFQRAKVLFDIFAGKLVYVGDPKQSTDYVQYPSETLSSRSGDCDDMTVAFSSLLSSVGMSTALIDVVPLDQPEKSHIYLLFDTGIDPKYGESVSTNPKRYVVRRNAHGKETIWIPVETTVIMKGFEEAWTKGAQEYFDDVEIGLGFVKGWVKIVDVN